MAVGNVEINQILEPIKQHYPEPTKGSKNITMSWASCQRRNVKLSGRL